jgi:hypothetical protein
MKTTLLTRLFALTGSLLFASLMTAGVASWMSASAEQASPAFAHGATKTAPAAAAMTVQATAPAHIASPML